MDELRLVGVHDDGEHLVLQDATGGRFLLDLDQQLRGTVQRARRVAPRRTSNVSGDFGPREIQARFRAGATVDEIVEESGWEAARVKRYEWPILAERAHIAREAQKVEVVSSAPRNGSYRSVFDGEPQTLAQTVAAHAADLGVATTSMDWDAWQRPDQQWQVSVRFRLSNPAVTPQEVVDQQPAAQWIFNPAGLTVTAENQWARLLTTTPQDPRALTGSDSLFGAPRTPSSTHTVATPPTPEAVLAHHDSGQAESADEPGQDERSQHTATASPETAPEGVASRRTADAPEDAPAQDTDELLEVLEARRGRRLGQDADSDDHLAEILGRNMGHLSRRPRPITAPQDSSLFDHPAHAAQPDPKTGDAGGAARAETGSGADAVGVDEVESPREATIHHLGRADERTRPATPVVEITDDDDSPLASVSESSRTDSHAPQSADSATVTQLRGVTAEPADEAAREGSDQEDAVVGGPDEVTDQATPATEPPSSGTPARPTDESPTDDSTSEATEPAPRPRPRGRVNSKRSRSSVPSWDEIVFGAKADD